MKEKKNKKHKSPSRSPSTSSNRSSSAESKKLHHSSKKRYKIKGTKKGKYPETFGSKDMQKRENATLLLRKVKIHLLIVPPLVMMKRKKNLHLNLRKRKVNWMN